jgi:hypothetical protein
MTKDRFKMLARDLDTNARIARDRSIRDLEPYHFTEEQRVDAEEHGRRLSAAHGRAAVVYEQELASVLAEASGVAPVERVVEAAELARWCDLAVELERLLDESLEIVYEFNAQWGGENLAKKWGLPDEIKALREKREALRSRAVPQASAEPNPDGGERLREAEELLLDVAEGFSLETLRKNHDAETAQKLFDWAAKYDARGGTT